MILIAVRRIKQGSSSHGTSSLTSRPRESDQRWRQDLLVLIERLRNIEAGKGSRRLTGQEIVELQDAGGKTPDWIGRSGGANGKLFREDVASGSWRTQSYEVRFGGGLPSRNWFSLVEFLEMVRAV
jgi:hypothetical protein